MLPRRQPAWLIVLIGVAALAVIGVGIGWTVYAHTYQPLGSGGIGVTYAPTPKTVKRTSDGIAPTTFVLTSPMGTRGVVDYTMENWGSHAVKILGLDDSRTADISVRWSDLSRNPGGGAELGLVSESRPFPVTLAPDESIFLQVTLTQPHCAGGFVVKVDGVPLRWSALGVHHVWNLDLTESQPTMLPIVLCPSKAVLAHAR